MVNLGLPVPQGFTVTTEACNEYYADGKIINDEMKKQIDDCLERLEKLADKKLGGLDNPLLVSVRSGAKFSMPGMMDTILNLGLNDETVEVVAKQTGNRRFAFDSYRRFIQMYSDVVCEVDKELFEAKLSELKTSKGYESDLDITAEDFENIIIPQYKEIFKTQLGRDFPQEAKEQMVFGNMGDDSGTGVLFTRNAANGDNHIYGEYLINAQGEDVVAGIRTPQKIAKLEEDMPEIYKQLVTIVKGLEKHYKDMQDMEITIEEGKLYFLQTRNGKRTAQAALKIAVDLVEDGTLTKEEAILKVEPKQLDTLLHPAFDVEELKKANVVAKGLPASPGAACGKIAFTADESKERAEKGEKVVLVRLETSPEDIEGMIAAEGILTVRGGMTSHAAVVARGMGTCCVAG